MIKHIVMWRLRGDTPDEKRAAARLVKTQFEALRGTVPGLRQIEIGVDVSGVDYACDVVLVSEFDSAESLAAYASHPAHLRVREALGDMRIARHQVDFVVDAP